MGLFSRHKHNTTSSSAPPPYTPSPAPSSQQSYAPPSPPKQPINPDSRPLPQGWISQYDPNSKRFFYVYTPTALCQWEHPADKPLNAAPPRSPNAAGRAGESASYYNQPSAQQQSYYPQQTQQPYYAQQQQRYYPQQMQPQYVMAGGSRPMGGGGGMSFGKMAAAGIGGGLLGSMIGDALFDRPDTTIIEENNYYDNDYNDFDGGGFGGGEFGGDDFF
ncbi:hypothetical protein BDF20DRAFT_882796 [Mycotypha africana]|uniref:uncharacterized protein n=1 Tax=Mycotypha africana TaxID=64632 RepID=UPI0023006B03|nr:uncharacterized protein BDF20DRAFT_882796 [Mycotypha africana]KAI8973515.1 hypothetical protein BDF20DRAFT_882796 [Mycotypha africana]